MTRKIAENEAQFNAELSKKLKAEKEKLKSQGLSSASIEERLKNLTQSIKLENDKKIAEFKREANAELKKKETELSKKIADYQNKLNSALAEQKKLETAYKQKETALKEQYQKEKEALESKQQATANELGKLEKQRRNEQFAFSQLSAIYTNIENSIDSGNYKDASAGLNNLDNFLAKEEIASLPSIKERLHIEKFIIKSLRNLITEKTTLKNPIDNKLKRISSMIKEADRLYNSGKTDLAREKYLETINAIPQVKKGYEKLTEIDKKQFEKSLSSTKAKDKRTIDSLRRILARKEKELTAKKRDVSALTSSIYNLQTQLKNSAEELSFLRAEEYRRKQNIENVLLKISDEDNRINSLLAGTSSWNQTSEEKLLSLLETKILVKRIVSSPSVKKKYPDLYNKLEKYFKALGREKQTEGELKALGDVLKILDYIIPTTQTFSGTTTVPPSQFKGYEYKVLKTLKDVLTRLKTLTNSF
ncbi:MAG: hypothetical protein DRP57_09940 [Spirochaetes bacterium]|nr:MAG: hypothetical protein DRP57_09940 [Spirochaetota bacterium]